MALFDPFVVATGLKFNPNYFGGGPEFFFTMQLHLHCVPLLQTMFVLAIFYCRLLLLLLLLATVCRCLACSRACDDAAVLDDAGT